MTKIDPKHFKPYSLMKILRNVILSILALFSLFIFIWSVLFSAYILASITFITSLLLLPMQLHNKFFWRSRVLLLFCSNLILVASIHYSVAEINTQIHFLAAKTRTADSTSAFTTRDKLGIYGLNLIMAVSAYPIYPEISKQTLLMVFPSPMNNTRVFESDFALESKKVQSLIRSFSKTLETETNREIKFEKRISWNSRDYALGNKESRYALALNPSLISIHATKQASYWIINISIKVVCRYPQNSHVILIKEPELAIEEGLFWVLQQEGWLHPYTADWQFQIHSDDKRLY